MKKTTLFIIVMMITSIYMMSSYNVLAQEDEEEQWDFTGVMRIGSDQTRIVYFNPTDHGFNATEGNYTSPLLYMEVLGVDTNNDIEMDLYFGFWGVNLFDTSHLNYTTQVSLFRVILNAKWSLRIPEESNSSWHVMYWPDPIYESLSLIHRTPVYYVNLTESVGVNLQYRIDYGLNYTLGNFTTFGASNPLVPDLPTFPGYNVSVPLFTANLPIAELTEASFFDGPASFIAIVSVISIGGYYIKKKRTRKKGK